MKQFIAKFALVVKDYDEAIAFYIHKLGFMLLEDTRMSDTKRWVRIAPPGYEYGQCEILLAKAADENQAKAIGNQSGGRVFLFLYTDDIARDYQNLIEQKIKIIRPLSTESYGTVAVFADLYGNLWDLIQPI
ncbi:VOC family protein [Aquiflexum sp. TKW24L]|uniref:VOC family protein n=1 Tax=Aquiflexum sp. TKW24L TaxID=2942212 RepID=UPI0020BE9135|nr:VOC family protein [Aquiflexum sp. TKW24L]MCL6260185.1 VOC family protein [Aquiflexum sp. TKW24L]